MSCKCVAWRSFVAAAVLWPFLATGGWVWGAEIDLSSYSSLKVVQAVPRKPTSAFNGRRRDDLRIDTKRWEPVPCVMFTACYELILSSPRQIFLAGNPRNTLGWKVDNFLLLEVLKPSGELLDRAVVGSTEPVLANGKSIPKLGPDSRSFNAGEVEITKILPVNVPFALRVTALVYEGGGFVNDIYLVGLGGVAPHGPKTAEGMAEEVAPGPRLDAPPLTAGETVIFENMNRGECQLTDSATFALKQDTMVLRLEIYFLWQEDESSIDYTIYSAGRVVRQGSFSRSISGNQKGWSFGVANIGEQLTIGTYTVELMQMRLCRNNSSGDNGFIRVISKGPSQ